MMSRPAVISVAAMLLFSILPSIAGDDDGFTERFTARLEGNRLVMGYSCEARNLDDSYEGKGTVTFQDGSFLLESPGFTVYDDGEEMWTIYGEAREAVVSPSAGIDLLSDPASLIRLFGFDGRRTAVKFVNGQDGMPRSVQVALKNGMEVVVRILSLSFLEKEDPSVFSFDPDSLDASYVVTDLR